VVERLGGAQDIEWATQGERVWLLQARPMTTPMPTSLPGRFPLWTAANLQEAIPRPLTPLSEEFARANIERIFGTSYAFAGLPQPSEPTVRIVRGRFYMSYSAMASAISSAPGFQMETLLLMFGDSPTLAASIWYRPGPRLRTTLRLPATLIRLLSWVLFADRYIEKVQEAARQFEDRVRSTLASNPSDARLLELFRSLATADRLPLDAMSIATALANRFVGVLMRTASNHELSAAGAAALGLASDLESLEPVGRLSALASWLRAHPDRADDDSEVQGRLAAFMEACGFRCAEEVEMASPRWVEQPHEVLRLARQLAAAPAGGVPSAAAALGCPGGVQGAAAALGCPGGIPNARSVGVGVQDSSAAAPRAIASTSRRGSKDPRLRSGAGTALPLRVRVIAAQARTWQRRRERTRALLSRFGMGVRILLLAIGRRLCDRKLLNAPDDIFYLHRGEIVSVLDRSALGTTHAELFPSKIERRRAHHRQMLKWPAPPRLLAELPDGRLAPYEVDPGAALGSPEGDALHGFGASPGRVTGHARVVRDLSEAAALKPGEILVTRTTDIGWTPLFRLAAAVVTEIGAPTSHAAIVARELGVPAVVNVGHVTDRVRTGDELFVDGWAGLVRRKVAGGDGGTPADRG